MSGKPLILFTGATGHLGFRTLVLALEAGYRVRVAYRRESQVAKLKQARSVQPYLSDIEYIHVADITAKGAFDQAVADAEYFLHIASPITEIQEGGGKKEDWQKSFYDPAVNGTLTALDAALRVSTIKRVVITGSVVALEAPEGSTVAGPHNLRAIPPQDVLSSFASSMHAYVFSKALAHKATDDWIAAHPDAHFDVVRVLPGYIQGANELQQTAQDVGAGSNEGTYNIALGNINDSPKPNGQVYLDDVARAHITSLNTEKVRAGQVLIAVANNGKGWSWDDFVPVVERLYPEEIQKGILSPRKGQADWVAVEFDTSQTYKTLGFEFQGIEAMVKSVVGQYLELKG